MYRAAVALTAVALATASCTATSSGSADDVSPSGGASVQSPDATVSATARNPSSPPEDTVGAAAVPSPIDPVTPAEQTAPASPGVVRDRFDAERATQFAVDLATEVGVRVAGTRGDYLARRRVALALVDAGWSVHADAVPLPQGGHSANLIASVGPPPAPSAPHVVIGAHLDTVPGSPGANDNATGVGVVVALAEELVDEADALPVPIVLVAFAAEEYQPGTRVHHVGSEQMAAARPGAVAMLSVDMVGDGPSTRIVGLRGTDDVLVRRLADVAGQAGIGKVVTDARGDVSDHGAFARRGVPAAFLWTGPTDHLHDASDTADRLDPADLQRAGDLVLAWVRDLGASDVDGLEMTAQAG